MKQLLQRYYFAVVLLPSIILTACNQESPASLNAADPSSVATTTDPVNVGANADAPSSSRSNPNVVVGESCESDDDSKLCLAVNFTTYVNSSGKAVASEAQAATIIKTMNKLFSGCKIGFQIEHYEAVSPTKYGLSYGAASQGEVDDIRRTFSGNDQLLSVTTGPWGTAVNAWTSMPGSDNYGAIMEASIVDYGGGIIYAHEFGHYLGLDHYGSTANLMNATIYTTSTQLTASQCQTAKATAREYWSRMLR